MSPASSSSGRRSAKPVEPPLPFFVFIAYSDVAAARDALARVKKMLAHHRRACALQPMLWRFDQLGQARWQEAALHDARRAHTIVLAMGNTSSLDVGTDAWLNALTSSQTGGPITCLALMRGEEAWTIALERTESRTAAATVPTPLRSTHTERLVA